MQKEFSGLDARFWNRMFHAAMEARGRYRRAAMVEFVVIIVMIIFFWRYGR